MKQTPLLIILHHAIDSVRPSHLIPQVFQERAEVVKEWKKAKSKALLCIGKASLNAGEAILHIYPEIPHFLLAPFDPSYRPIRASRIHWGSHPLPDQKSFESAGQLLSWLETLPADTSLLVLLSGGASALMVYPAEGISLQAKIEVNDLLIRSGASIHEINTVRKHLSQVKGGQLARHCRHLKTVVLVISDVIGDDLSTIGSGPFYKDATTYRDAKYVLEKYDLWKKVHPEIREHIEKGIQGVIPETLKAEDSDIPHHIIASNTVARQAAMAKALELGYQIVAVEKPLSEPVEKSAEYLRDKLLSLESGTVLIGGGEVTVQWKGTGRGGRNQHLALLLVSALAGTDLCFAAVGTDGVDGNSPAAGAWVDGTTLKKAQLLGLEIQHFIENFDSFTFFERLARTIETGPTGTNVMDLYIGLR